MSLACTYSACAVYDASMLEADDKSSNAAYTAAGQANAGTGGAGLSGGGGAQPDGLSGGAGDGTGSVAGDESRGGNAGSAGRAVGGNANGGSVNGEIGGTGPAASGASPVGGSSGAAGGQASGGSASDAGGGNAGAAPSGVDPCLRKNWKASASKSSLSTETPSLYNPPVQAIDGMATTRWSTGAPQTGGEWFIVDLGGVAAHLTQIALDTGGHPADYPVSYKLEASTDGSSYAFVTSGSGSSQTTIKFSDKPARYLKITQTGSSASWWSIHELSISCQSN